MIINKSKFLTLIIDNYNPTRYTHYYNKNVMLKDRIIDFCIYIGGRQRIAKANKILYDEMEFDLVSSMLDRIIKTFKNRRKSVFYSIK